MFYDDDIMEAIETYYGYKATATIMFVFLAVSFLIAVILAGACYGIPVGICRCIHTICEGSRGKNNIFTYETIGNCVATTMESSDDIDFKKGIIKSLFEIGVSIGKIISLLLPLFIIGIIATVVNAVDLVKKLISKHLFHRQLIQR